MKPEDLRRATLYSPKQHRAQRTPRNSVPLPHWLVAVGWFGFGWIVRDNWPAILATWQRLIGT